MRSPHATFSCSRRAAIGQEPKAQSLVLPPPPPDAAAPLLCLTTAFTGPRLRVLLLLSLFYHTFQFTQKILSFVLKKLQINPPPGRHLWTERTHTCSWAVLAANSPYSCYRAELQLICIFLALISKHLQICSLSWGT